MPDSNVKKVLVTGGAGFIGSYVVDELVRLGHEVTIFDNLTAQVHPNGKPPEYLNTQAQFVRGDVCDADAFRNVLQGKQWVVHFASAVGVAQSMYEIAEYVRANTLGTAVLLDLLVNTESEVEKVLVAASMSSYGEGLYVTPDQKRVRPPLRTAEQMARGEWELVCPETGQPLKPVPTPEEAVQNCNSIYSLTKKTQEDMVLMIGKTYDIPSVALRFFNVYGPRQSLSNPYTGVAAIFMSRVKNGQSPIVFEDGLQTRDFISVHDIAGACCLALKSSQADYEVFNLGSGDPVTIKEVAEIVAEAYGRPDLSPDITYQFRKGDTRHCFADIAKIRSRLGFQPRVSLREGVKELIDWSRTVESKDRTEEALAELRAKGLL